MKLPFAYYGSKADIADEVWRRFGPVRHYVEPFCGSAAVLLARPDWSPECIETINDISGALINFFRAAKLRPDDMLRYLAWPAVECDLIARQNVVLQAENRLREKLISDPEYCDPALAAYYAYVSTYGIGAVWKRPYRSHQLPAFSKALVYPENYWQTMIYALRERLQTVRVACGDWKRVVRRATLLKNGTPVAVFLDPPYPSTYCEAYVAADESTMADVVEWALQTASDDIRIAVCGLPEHLTPLYDAGWQLFEWRRDGSYTVQARRKPRNDTSDAAAFSPSCGRRLL